MSDTSGNAESQPPENENAQGSAVSPDAARAEALEAELARLKDHLLRALADAENTRKRAQRDREDAGKYAITAFARDLLDFGDNFHRALAAIPQDIRADQRIAGVMAGIESMEKELARAFEKHGITKIMPLDQPFDANFHEVMFEAPVPGKPAGIIIEVIEPGYVIRDRLLRPARVGVAKGEPSGHAGPHRIDTEA
jgi:molecular chaperone GrpE